MAFGLKRDELQLWKEQVKDGNISFLTHYWEDERFPGCYTVTKVGCSDLEKLTVWGETHELHPNWIHMDQNYPHFDLFGDKQKEILIKENQFEQLKKFNL
ncbi:hypothetical protein VBD025_11955 [Virgibacillus flavescens]|uniref:hypothetical protein n=1 Tax=Virgibacillus flavescens TaxID=1611422 RepID=UPI003D32BACF